MPGSNDFDQREFKSSHQAEERSAYGKLLEVGDADQALYPVPRHDKATGPMVRVPDEVDDAGVGPNKAAFGQVREVILHGLVRGLSVEPSL
jgi:hypothetical protein